MKIREVTAKTVIVEITPEEISTLFPSLARQRDALRHSLKEQDPKQQQKAAILAVKGNFLQSE